MLLGTGLLLPLLKGGAQTYAPPKSRMSSPVPVSNSHMELSPLSRKARLCLPKSPTTETQGLGFTRKDGLRHGHIELLNF